MLIVYVYIKNDSFNIFCRLEYISECLTNINIYNVLFSHYKV